MAGEAELADFALLKAVTAVVQSAEAQASHPGLWLSRWSMPRGSSGVDVSSFG